MAGLQAPLSTLRPRTSRCATHDSGPVWFAIPSLFETFTRYSLSISRRTSVRFGSDDSRTPNRFQRTSALPHGQPFHESPFSFFWLRFPHLVDWALVHFILG